MSLSLVVVVVVVVVSTHTVVGIIWPPNQVSSLPISDPNNRVYLEEYHQGNLLYREDGNTQRIQDPQYYHEYDHENQYQNGYNPDLYQYQEGYNTDSYQYYDENNPGHHQYYEGYKPNPDTYHDAAIPEPVHYANEYIPDSLLTTDPRQAEYEHQNPKGAQQLYMEGYITHHQTGLPYTNPVYIPAHLQTTYIDPAEVPDLEEVIENRYKYQEVEHNNLGQYDKRHVESEQGELLPPSLNDYSHRLPESSEEYTAEHNDIIHSDLVYNAEEYTDKSNNLYAIEHSEDLHQDTLEYDTAYIVNNFGTQGEENSKLVQIEKLPVPENEEVVIYNNAIDDSESTDEHFLAPRQELLTPFSTFLEGSQHNFDKILLTLFSFIFRRLVL